MSIPAPIIWNDCDDNTQEQVLSRPALADSVSLKATVSDVLKQVRQDGDNAIIDLTKQFDKVELTQLRLPLSEIQQAANQVSDEVKKAIDLAYDNIKQFHDAQMPDDISVETQTGVVCEQKFVALEKVGLYIPGGTAPLPSTVLMLGVASQAAGCAQKILCTPPSKSKDDDKQCPVAPEILYAALKCGISDVFLCGGAQAIAGMAYGTNSIPKVDKIFGPGNSFVTEAKQQVSQQAFGAAIDMPAGPSEVLVLADKSAKPSFVAADLLSQAEHGIDSQAILVSDSLSWTRLVQAEVEAQLALLSRRTIAQQAISNSRFIVTNDLSQSIEVTNAYAAEHLIIQTQDAQDVAARVKHAGSIFVGAYTPESAGDYASGTNHVLPTYGYARN
jgi:histidinol dehydrogenase